MKKIQLIMADPDKAYIESVSSYLRTSNQAFKFDLKSFSDGARLQEYISSESHFDILVAAPELLPDSSVENQTGLIIILEDGRILERRAELASVFKYQPLNQLFSDILSVYYGNSERVKNIVDGKSKTNVISVYSATGGAGKTTLAVNLCKQMALRDQKVFYLNLELLHSTPLFFSSLEHYDSSQILYHLKANPEQLISKIESFKKYDPYMKVDYFDFPVNAVEMKDVSRIDTETLINSLIEIESYDSIIVDLDSSIEERTKASLNKSDQILWLISDDLQSFHKTFWLFDNSKSLFGEKKEIRSKATMILNKHTGQFLKEFYGVDLPVSHQLPYIPEWKNVSEGRQILSSPIYSNELLSIIKTIEEPMRGVAFD